MHGKVLVIDPIATHRIMLRVKLASSQYDVLQAASLNDAMTLLTKVTPDLILTSTSLPNATPGKMIARMRKARVFNKVPVIAICGENAHVDDRVSLLSQGFDDVISRPFDTGFLMARARSLLRSYSATSEWQLREGTSRALGFAEPGAQILRRSRIKVVARRPEAYRDLRSTLGTQLGAEVSASIAADAVKSADGQGAPDAYLLMTGPHDGAAALDLLAALRCHAATRHAVILVAQVDGPTPLAGQMLDTGASDVAPLGAEDAELVLRLQRMIARKQKTDALRETMRNGVEAAVIDPLTGLHNRRYALPHVNRIAERAQLSGKCFALMIADIDHFKRVNDTYGHAAGDTVLVEVAERLRQHLRAVDLVARIGGEEFLMVLPGVTLEAAHAAAQRLCQRVGGTPIQLPGNAGALTATISIGMIVCDLEKGGGGHAPMNAQELLDRADQALYDAKAEGRNRVTLCQAAA